MPLLNTCLIAQNAFVEDWKIRDMNDSNLCSKENIAKVSALTRVVIRNHEIKVGVKKFEFTTLTYTVNSNGPDDTVYGKSAILIKAIPRSYTLYGNIIDGEFRTWAVLHGMEKMKAITPDNDDDQAELSKKQAGKDNSNLRELSVDKCSNHRQFFEAFKSGDLVASISLKDNGKFSQFSLAQVKIGDEFHLLFLCSSKSVPTACAFEDIGKVFLDETDEDLKTAHTIINKVFRYFKTRKDKFLQLYEQYLSIEYWKIPSVCAELSDGQHICPVLVPENLNNPVIFGSYLYGNSLPVDFSVYRKLGFLTVGNESIDLSKFSSLSQLMDFMLEQMACSKFEGGVGKLTTGTRLTMQFKVKSSRYKVLRSLRELFSNKGWWPEGELPFVLAELFSQRHKANYNNLNTDAIIRFIDFAVELSVWAMKSRLPVDYVKCISVSGTLGVTDTNGFGNLIERFCKETGKPDTLGFTVSDCDIGNVDIERLQFELHRKYVPGEFFYPNICMFYCWKCWYWEEFSLGKDCVAIGTHLQKGRTR